VSSQITTTVAPGFVALAWMVYCVLMALRNG